MRPITARSSGFHGDASPGVIILRCSVSPVKRAANPPCALEQVGEWLSLVEHLVRDQGVGGSNPLSPTNLLNPVIELANFRFPKQSELGAIWVD
jgi:hypothetical protein